MIEVTRTSWKSIILECHLWIQISTKHRQVHSNIKANTHNSSPNGVPDSGEPLDGDISLWIAHKDQGVNSMSHQSGISIYSDQHHRISVWIAISSGFQADRWRRNLSYHVTKCKLISSRLISLFFSCQTKSLKIGISPANCNHSYSRLTQQKQPNNTNAKITIQKNNI